MTDDLRINTAIFGGKFDPPHLAHQMSIFLALEKYRFDEVWVIPSFSHPFDFHPSDFDRRLEMCRIMARPWGDRVKVMDTEREIGTEKVYTVDLIRYLIGKYPQNGFSLVIGSDNWDLRTKWKDFDEIERLCRTVEVIGRGLDSTEGFSLPNISSTMIKQRIHEGKDVSHLLPDGIAEYIREHGLYS